MGATVIEREDVGQALAQHRADLQLGETAGWDRFDDLVFKVAAGALALSVTFLGVLKERVALQSVGVVFVSWLSLVGALAALMTSVVLSAVAHRAGVRQFDEGHVAESHSTMTRWNRWVFSSNLVAAALCVVGLLLLLWFAAANVRTTTMASATENARPTTTSPMVERPAETPPNTRGRLVPQAPPTKPPQEPAPLPQKPAAK